MIRVEIAMRVVTTSPLSVGAGGSAGSLADKTIVRDGWGRPLLPGSQLKGKARHSAESLATALGLPLPASFDDNDTDTVIRRLFGSPAFPSPLRFADLVGVVGLSLPQPEPSDEQRGKGQIRPSVALNRQRRTAEDARLLFQETALDGMHFVAERAVVGRLDQLELLALLWAALRLVPRWGGASSRGLGWAAPAELTVVWNGEQVDDGRLKEALRALPAWWKEQST